MKIHLLKNTKIYSMPKIKRHKRHKRKLYVLFSKNLMGSHPDFKLKMTKLCCQGSQIKTF